MFRIGAAATLCRVNTDQSSLASLPKDITGAVRLSPTAVRRHC